MFTRYVLPAVAVLALLFAAFQVSKAQQKPEPTAPPVEPGKSPYVKQLAGAGIVEPETENIAVGSFTPGVVDKVLVKVGQTVTGWVKLAREQLRESDESLEAADRLVAWLTERAEEDARTAGVAGARITPFLLVRLAELSGGIRDVSVKS